MRSALGLALLTSGRSVRSVVSCALLFCLLLLQIHLYLSPTLVSTELVAGTGLIAVVLALVGVTAFRTCLDVPLIAYFGIGLAGSIVRGTIPAWSATLAMVPLYYGLVYAIRDPFRLRVALVSTVMCQVLVGVLALYYHAAVGFERRLEIQYLAVSQWSGYPEFGFLQALAIPSAFAMVVAGPTPLARIAGLVLSTVIAGVALGLSSRGAWVAAGAAFLAIAGIEVMRFRRGRLVLALPIGLAMAIGAWHWSRLFRELILGFLPAHGAPDDRMEVMKATLVLIRDHPWFGVGLGQIQRALADTDVARRAAYATAHAHNMYLHVAAETGIPALLAFLWLWWTVLRSLVQGLASDDRLDLVRLGLLGSVVAFMVRGLTDNFLGGLATSLRFNVVLWTMFAMVASLDRLPKGRAAMAPAPRPDNAPAVSPA